MSYALNTSRRAPLPASLPALTAPPADKNWNARTPDVRALAPLAAAFLPPVDARPTPTADPETSRNRRWLDQHHQKLAAIARARTLDRARRARLHFAGGDAEVNDDTFASAQLVEERALRIAGAARGGETANDGTHAGQHGHADHPGGDVTTSGWTPDSGGFGVALDELLACAGLDRDATHATDEQIDAALRQTLALAAESMAAGEASQIACATLIGRFRSLFGRLPFPRASSLAETAALLGTVMEALSAPCRRHFSDGNAFLLLPLIHLAMTRGERALNHA